MSSREWRAIRLAHRVRREGPGEAARPRRERRAGGNGERPREADRRSIRGVLCGDRGRGAAPLASVPYLTRTLGPEAWGELAIAQAVATVLAVLVDYGHAQSATPAIAATTRVEWFTEDRSAR